MKPNSGPETAQRTTQKTGGKRKYDSPRILFREPLEAVAAICTPPPGGAGKAEAGINGCTIPSS